MYFADIESRIGEDFSASENNVNAYDYPGASQVVYRFNTGDSIGRLTSAFQYEGNAWMEFNVDGDVVYIKFNDNVAPDVSVSSKIPNKNILIGLAILFIAVIAAKKRRHGR